MTLIVHDTKYSGLSNEVTAACRDRKAKVFQDNVFFQAKNQGRLPDTGVPYLQNGSAVMDFQWDPFDDHVLAVGQ